MKVENTQVMDITDHPYSAHSRRPAQCRICKAPAGMHDASEHSHRSLWKSLRYPLVTDRFQGYSARTLGVLTAIAALGGNVDSWDLRNRGWHKTAVSILIKDMIIIELNPDTHPRQYTLSEAGRQVCAWHGIEITAQDGPAAPDSVNDDHDTAMDAWAVSVAGRVARYAKRHHLSDAQAEFMITELTATLGDTWKRAESEIWAGTGTDVRTRPGSFRKIKNTRSNRARRGGAR
jgi:hypothetical protein